MLESVSSNYFNCCEVLFQVLYVRNFITTHTANAESVKLILQKMHWQLRYAWNYNRTYTN